MLLTATVAALLSSVSNAQPVKTAFERGIGPKALDLPMRSFELRSKCVGDRLVIDVMLPPGYDASKDHRYPVFYMTDGYWRRGEYGVVHALAQEGKAEPCIVVGVGYPAGYDFSAIRPRDLVRTPEAFLASFATEIIPAIDREYRTDPARRILWGASYGGYFSLIAFSLHDIRGELFQTYISVSPMLRPNVNRYPDIMAALTGLKKRAPDIDVSLYLAVGGDETDTFIDSFETFDSFFRKSGFSHLRFRSKIYPKEVHNTVIVPTLPEIVPLYLPPLRW